MSPAADGFNQSHTEFSDETQLIRTPLVVTF